MVEGERLKNSADRGPGGNKNRSASRRKALLRERRARKVLAKVKDWGGDSNQPSGMVESSLCLHDNTQSYREYM